MFYHNPNVENMAKIVEYRFCSAEIHFGLQQKIIECLQYAPTV